MDNIKGRAFGAGGDSQLRVCCARLSSVRGSTHPCGSAAAGNEGLRRGVLQARRLMNSRASCTLTSLAERARLGILAERTRAGDMVLT
jgi:hypothetical protein